ncbi:hypothetical protein PMIN03_012399 [Paraphaeosphaeria minitans]
MVQTATTFWKTHALVVPADDTACLAEDTQPPPHYSRPAPEEGRLSLLSLARMVNLATYTHDDALLNTIHTTLRARLLSAAFTLLSSSTPSNSCGESGPCRGSGTRWS